MKRYLIIVCLAASYASTTALAEDTTAASPSQTREYLEQSAADQALPANELASRDKQDEKPQTVANEKTRDPKAVPYVTDGVFGSTE